LPENLKPTVGYWPQMQTLGWHSTNLLWPKALHDFAQNWASYMR
jgi:hypothetical protein